ncbi:ribosome-associated protein [Atopostipes suicloacalis DSM 15692]|uniref:Ribosomal silencing factor RsfS n=1 Tax=Atopostipes suicloacalis DSM 15692 TaxID=1121025 RepID=A0A1M4SZ52_9LACT|nr:ribosome silencing factor [Atopostipes suicloacalis]SHE37496.1 ribosome-associated protein [Atopostipes suicloacalis DSM 15692]
MGNTPEELLELVVRTADDRQAKDIIAIDMREISILTDYNVIAHASNKRLINAIADSIVEAATKAGIEVKSIEGKQSRDWILIDLGDVIFHVFDEEERSRYRLESLWTEAPTVDITDWMNE